MAGAGEADCSPGDGEGLGEGELVGGLLSAGAAGLAGAVLDPAGAEGLGAGRGVPEGLAGGEQLGREVTRLALLVRVS